MPITDNSQGACFVFSGYMKVARLWRWLLPALLASCLLGCLPLREAQAPGPDLGLSFQAEYGAPAAGKEGHGLGLWWGLLGSGLAGYILVWRVKQLWRQWQEECGGAAHLDREDVALLRTAREALVFLLRKRLRQRKVVGLAWFRGRRGSL